MTVSADTFSYISELVRRESAIRLAPGKEYLVESRLLPLARKQGMQGDHAVDQFVRKLKAAPNPAEISVIVEALTTTETSFFRDSTPFTTLRTELLPALHTRGGGVPRSLRVWSAAASTGQEAYSIGMTLQEAGHEQFSIFGTDLNTVVLEQARQGLYSQLEVNRGLPAPMLVKYFDRVGAGWQVKDTLRRKMRFEQHNLLRPFPPSAHYDIVFLRNVLIYFDLPVKQDILARVKRVLSPGGFLVLGAAETTVGVDNGWERLDIARSSVYRLPGGKQ